jgi:hypothetical protein
MTTDTKIPNGVTAQPHNCWELIYPATGLPVETSDGTRHFDSRDHAEQWADGMSENGEPGANGLTLREMAAPCWIVTAICGWKLDEELPMVMHHDSADEALRAALDSGMKVSPNGGLVCDESCEECMDDGKPRPDWENGDNDPEDGPTDIATNEATS